jgi:nitrate reductase gamma subunit
MQVNILISFVAVIVLFLVGQGGAEAGLQNIFGIVIPYLAAVVFLIGIILRVLGWANIPVPFRIPTTCGQQKSLPWIKESKVDNPFTKGGVVVRMILEILFFRSLLNNTKTELRKNGKLAYAISLSLWLGSMLFHWSMLIILMRHLRFFTEPIPYFITVLQHVDGFILVQVMAPVFYVTTALFLAGLVYLTVRRITNPQVRYISLANDYFPLFLLLGIGITGAWLRHLAKTDVVGVKELIMGLVKFSPSIPETVSSLFYGHLFLVCILVAYFPFSKLVHMAGVFLSPTRNMANNNRAVRHINPWDYPVKVHTYEEYEDEFRDKMKAAGIPVEKE